LIKDSVTDAKISKTYRMYQLCGMLLQSTPDGPCKVQNSCAVLNLLMLNNLAQLAFQCDGTATGQVTSTDLLECVHCGMAHLTDAEQRTSVTELDSVSVHEILTATTTVPLLSGTPAA
jgi:hypothetical protein